MFIEAFVSEFVSSMTQQAAIFLAVVCGFFCVKGSHEEAVERLL